MKTCEGGIEPFIVAPATMEAGDPRKGAFDDPAPRHENEAAFGLSEFHDAQVDARLRSCGGRPGTAIALIGTSDFDRLAGDRLHLRRERAGLRTLPDIGGSAAALAALALRSARANSAWSASRDELTAVYVPELTAKAIRDLCCAGTKSAATAKSALRGLDNSLMTSSNAKFAHRAQSSTRAKCCPESPVRLLPPSLRA